MKALIFDVDGTLAETEEMHREAFNRAFAETDLGWHWSPERYRALLSTTGGKERIARHAAVVGARDLPVAALHALKTKHYQNLMAEGCALRPGIAALLTEARAQNLRLAVATTTTETNVDALCRAALGCAAAEVFEVIAAGDMVAAKKPAPDVYLLALRQLGLSAAETVAFEDSANGVRAARAAGIPVVLSRGYYTRQEADQGATLVLDCFSALGGLSGLRRALGVTA